jgi:hypothetical protein
MIHAIYECKLWFLCSRVEVQPATMAIPYCVNQAADHKAGLLRRICACGSSTGDIRTHGCLCASNGASERMFWTIAMLVNYYGHQCFGPF